MFTEYLQLLLLSILCFGLIAFFFFWRKKEKLKSISKEWKLIEEKTILEQELIESDKLAIIGKLAAGIAHEINNPLFIISGEAEMLKQANENETKIAAQNITSQIARIKEITNNLLGFASKNIQFKLEPLTIKDVLETSLNLLSYEIKMENVQIVKELSPALPEILGSKVQIEQVFVNIIHNAIQAMSGQGILTIKTRTEGTKESKKVIIEINDSGCGIDPKIISRIFDPFFSTKDSGLGLGLTITSKIIENHKGEIKVESRSGKGSTFTVLMPIYSGEVKHEDNISG